MSGEKNKGGAPTKYNEEILSLAKEYADNWQSTGDAVPQLVSMYIKCKIDRHTGANYRKRHPEFDAVCARVEAEQERELINKGLTRETDAGLSKLMLIRHGYSDRQEIDMNSKVSVSMVDMKEL